MQYLLRLEAREEPFMTEGLLEAREEPFMTEGLLEAREEPFMTEGKFGFLPKTNWLGESPYTLCREFLTLTAQARAISNGHFVSATIFCNHIPNYCIMTSAY